MGFKVASSSSFPPSGVADSTDLRAAPSPPATPTLITTQVAVSRVFQADTAINTEKASNVPAAIHPITKRMVVPHHPNSTRQPRSHRTRLGGLVAFSDFAPVDGYGGAFLECAPLRKALGSEAPVHVH